MNATPPKLVMLAVAACAYGVLWPTIALGAPQGHDSGTITVTGTVVGRTPVSVATGMEDVNHEIYGGIYSQMIFGEAFAEPERSPGLSGMWRPTGPGARFSLVAEAPYKGSQSQRITRTGGSAWVGIENGGLNRQGMSVVGSKPYEGLLAMRADRATTVRVSFQSGDGSKVYATRLLPVSPGGWRKYPLTLLPSQSDRHARLAIELAVPGSVDVGYAFVQPGPWGRFTGLPIRVDVVRAMQAQGLQAIRFGGCANSGCGDVSDYKWKAMIGDPALRPVTRGFWYPHESNGFGIFEFLQLGEALGIEAVPSLNIDESPDDIRDLMEYLYGSPRTRWGARRVADGHPQPYKVRRFELGNEVAVDDAYFDKFKAMAEIIWSYDRDIKLVVGDFNYVEEIKDPFSFRGGGKVSSLAAHKRILELAAKWNAEVDFDVHIWTRSIADSGWEHKGGNLGSQIAALDSYAAALRSIGPKEARFKVVVFELNANSHDLTRALANAYAITSLQERAYIDVISSANAFQVDGQNDNGWDQGLIFMNQAAVWTQPPYEIDRMVAWSLRGDVVRTDVRGGDPLIAAAAFRDAGGLSLNVVNPTDRAMRYDVDFGAAAASAPLRMMRLGPDRASAVNTSANPHNIEAEASTDRVDGSGHFALDLPPRSFTVMRTGR